MRQGNRYGFIALAFGIGAILFGIAASHASSVRIPGSANILNWLNTHGFVKEPDAGRTAVLESPSVLLITDGIAIEWLLVNSLCFAVFALLWALWAEFKREETLCLSAGFVCGALALAIYSLPLSFATMVIGAVCMTLLRRESRDA
jgi:hypothetical protein